MLIALPSKVSGPAFCWCKEEWSVECLRCAEWPFSLWSFSTWKKELLRTRFSFVLRAFRLMLLRGLLSSTCSATAGFSASCLSRLGMMIGVGESSSALLNDCCWMCWLVPARRKDEPEPRWFCVLLKAFADFPTFGEKMSGFFCWFELAKLTECEDLERRILGSLRWLATLELFLDSQTLDFVLGWFLMCLRSRNWLLMFYWRWRSCFTKFSLSMAASFGFCGSSSCLCLLLTELRTNFCLIFS